MDPPGPVRRSGAGRRAGLKPATAPPRTSPAGSRRSRRTPSAWVCAIGDIRTIIEQISELQTTVAGAVEQQSATTAEIARNVAEAADGAHDIATRVGDVTGATRLTADAVQSALAAAGQMTTTSRELHDAVAAFTL